MLRRAARATKAGHIKRATYATSGGFSKANSWWELRALAWKRDNGKCVDCMARKEVQPGKEVHHIIPLNRGGLNVLSNLITLCQPCHDKRHAHLKRSRG